MSIKHEVSGMFRPDFSSVSMTLEMIQNEKEYWRMIEKVYSTIPPLSYINLNVSP